ncbi:hypothetical protein PAXRUDRAFT_138246 [Paxillus rubicundulus Ve08.2h10]|uniref:Uncharacterized protein n=1 Tax=Paxillus rubicundulus Ve08.2h10 TaxID=930991 RepID=A0A0D0EAE2_9AGAM|nr:hypothetical protein PAXRUDRAFT_138246 [Paxillus rubicundulus Ve08.2h10]
MIDDTWSSRCKCKVPRCCGRLVLKFNNFHQPYIQCSNCSPGMGRAHLLLHNLQEFNILYLCPLLNNDSTMYLCIENFAKSLGIGLLAPCTFAASPSEQKSDCHTYLPCLFSELYHSLHSTLALRF